MKLAIITYNQAFDGDVLRVLSACGLENYTKWTSVEGKGEKSGPHLMTHVWPKANNVLMVAVEDEDSEKLMEGVKELRSRVESEGVKAFLVPVEAVT